MTRYILLALLLALPMGACGHKGSLKTPSQAESDRQKQEHRAAKEAEKKKKEEEQKQEKKGE